MPPVPVSSATHRQWPCLCLSSAYCTPRRPHLDPRTSPRLSHPHQRPLSFDPLPAPLLATYRKSSAASSRSGPRHRPQQHQPARHGSLASRTAHRSNTFHGYFLYFLGSVFAPPPSSRRTTPVSHSSCARRTARLSCITPAHRRRSSRTASSPRPSAGLTHREAAPKGRRNLAASRSGHSRRRCTGRPARARAPKSGVPRAVDRDGRHPSRPSWPTGGRERRTTVDAGLRDGALAREGDDRRAAHGHNERIRPSWPASPTHWAGPCWPTPVRAAGSTDDRRRRRHRPPIRRCRMLVLSVRPGCPRALGTSSHARRGGRPCRGRRPWSQWADPTPSSASSISRGDPGSSGAPHGVGAVIPVADPVVGRGSQCPGGRRDRPGLGDDLSEPLVARGPCTGMRRTPVRHPHGGGIHADSVDLEWYAEPSPTPPRVWPTGASTGSTAWSRRRWGSPPRATDRARWRSWAT